jgi:hypothetical protein
VYCRSHRNIFVQARSVVARHLLPYFLPEVSLGVIVDGKKLIRHLSILSDEAITLQNRIIKEDEMVQGKNRHNKNQAYRSVYV